MATTLILSGGTGVGRISALLRALDEAFEGLSITVSAGTNRALAARLQRQAHRSRNSVRVIELVEGIDRLFLEADVLITKPGGLTTSEAAVAGLPMILTAGIPGQEAGNARYFLSSGAALPGATPGEAVASLRRLREDAGLRSEVSAALQRLARPLAAADLLRLSPRSVALEAPAEAGPRLAVVATG